jgi:hypothetical protein
MVAILKANPKALDTYAEIEEQKPKPFLSTILKE